MKTFLIAIQFLTILPIRLKSQIKEEDFKSIFIFFPLVGACIGIFLWFLSLLLGAMPRFSVVAVILTVYTVLTGALHLDGLADSCDGLLSGKSKEKSLEIMQDSHIGTYAAVGVSLVLILKFAFFVCLTKTLFLKMLILVPVFSRWVQGLACSETKYVRTEGKSTLFFKAVSKKDIFWGGFFSLAIFIILLQGKGLILFLAALLPVGLFIKFVEKKISGMTGDTIGATSEIAEISLLFFSFFIIA